MLMSITNLDSNPKKQTLNTTDCNQNKNQKIQTTWAMKSSPQSIYLEEKDQSKKNKISFQDCFLEKKKTAEKLDFLEAMQK